MSFSRAYHFSSMRQDWETPQWLFDKLDKEFAFTLDACATKATAKCADFFGPEDEAMFHSWSGRVWVNPPYKRNRGWVEKATLEIVNCEVIVIFRNDSERQHGR